ncbi:MAG: hypothetical protein GEU98_23740 [Pseudonocardiaceae bacterium]|nr:hypothetical protein [Pseudonocardiaceae bacterium]
MSASSAAVEPAQPKPRRFARLAWIAFLCGIVGTAGAPLLTLHTVTAIIAGAGVLVGVVAAFGSSKLLALISIAMCVVGIVFTVLIGNLPKYDAQSIRRELHRTLEHVEQAKVPIVINYEVLTSGPGIAAVTYLAPGREVVHHDNVGARWSTSLNVVAPLASAYGLLGENVAGGAITCRITVNGIVISESIRSGERATATCYG